MANHAQAQLPLPFLPDPEPSQEQLDYERGRSNIITAWRWVRDNAGEGGAWNFMKRWLTKAEAKGKRTSLRCCLDTLGETRQNYTDRNGRVPSTGHALSGALSRVVLVLHPEYESILEQRPSKLLDAFTQDDVSALCPYSLVSVEL